MAKLKGSTLIETLAALTIIVLISGMAFSLFGTLQKSGKGIKELKASFLADKYLDMEGGELSEEEGGLRIEKSLESKEGFVLVRVQVLNGNKLLLELNKWKEEND